MTFGINAERITFSDLNDFAIDVKLSLAVNHDVELFVIRVSMDKRNCYHGGKLVDRDFAARQTQYVMKLFAIFHRDSDFLKIFHF